MNRRVVVAISSDHPSTRYRLGGDCLVSVNDEREEFFVITGPTPWGCGTWGPFPVAVITAEREPSPNDSWPVSGCPSRRWTVADLERRGAA